MTEEDWKVAQLVLTLFRNLLAIPDPAPTAASGNDHLTRGRDVLLERLFQEDVMDLLLAVTQDANRLPFRNEVRAPATYPQSAAHTARTSSDPLRSVFFTRRLFCLRCSTNSSAELALRRSSQLQTGTRPRKQQR